MRLENDLVEMGLDADHSSVPLARKRNRASSRFLGKEGEVDCRQERVISQK